MSVVTRFAPSPTGWLHLGHAYAAILAEEQASRNNGRFLIRLEDIDSGRSRPEYETALFEDLAWLGLTWELPVRRQSEHQGDYRQALTQLDSLGLLYPCFCTRREIQDEIARASQAPHGPDGPLYPGTCRNRNLSEAADFIANGQPYAMRLNVEKAISFVDKELRWEDAARGPQVASPAIFGDVVLARKDTPASYHLAVVVDDALQDITLVTRGEDLFEATHLHRLLQDLLKLPVPVWHHHSLVTDEKGKRLAKRDDARSLRTLRQEGWTPEDIRAALPR